MAPTPTKVLMWLTTFLYTRYFIKTLNIDGSSSITENYKLKLLKLQNIYCLLPHYKTIRKPQWPNCLTYYSL